MIGKSDLGWENLETETPFYQESDSTVHVRVFQGIPEFLNSTAA